MNEAMQPLSLALAALGLLVAMPATANPLKSLYTTIELEQCRQTRTEPGGGAWICAGLAGYPVFIAEGDMRTFVSVGPEPEKRRAATQTLRDFNSLFKGKRGRATLEWRIIRRDGRPVPFATIQRYFTRHDTAKSEVLVVTKVTAQEDCHVAYIDALANRDAIVLAREIADREAREFDCKREPSVRGRTGDGPASASRPK
jgi:hypothetical protein